MKFKLDNRGVSLAMTIGLLLLITTLTVTINELVVRALRASHQIEAADKAYLAAEAGIENALYELSVHSAGYQTRDFGDADVRVDEFDSNINWNNEWQIASDNTSINSCANMEGWAGSYTPDFCGRIYEDKKLTINLFRDQADPTGVGVNGINKDNPSNIVTLDLLGGFFIRFRVPRDVVRSEPGAFPSLTPLRIDNDDDYDPADPSGTLNEDGADLTDYPLNACSYSGGVLLADNDCDGREDEDSLEDPVFLWKILDDAGHLFTPIRGCKGNLSVGPQTTYAPPYPDSNICEESFYLLADEAYVDIDQVTDYGTNENGNYVRLRDFLQANLGANNLRLEILPVAPFEVINAGAGVGEAERVPFPYIEYGIEYVSINDLPSTSFELRADGYFQDYKQSITTSVMPRATTKLLDLTIIQQ